MSVVTSVTIISQCCNEDSIGALVNQLNQWIKGDAPCGGVCGGGCLVEIDEFYGGTKHPECLVWGGGFNYLSWQEFIAFAESLPWRDAVTVPDEEQVILVVCPDQRTAEVRFLNKNVTTPTTTTTEGTETHGN